MPPKFWMYFLSPPYEQSVKSSINLTAITIPFKLYQLRSSLLCNIFSLYFFWVWAFSLALHFHVFVSNIWFSERSYLPTYNTTNKMIILCIFSVLEIRWASNFLSEWWNAFSHLFFLNFIINLIFIVICVSRDATSKTFANYVLTIVVS
jgi:hypothetical protein